MQKNVCVYLGEDLAAYHFGHAHPFGPHRYRAFESELRARGLDRRVRIQAPVQAGRAEVQRFHTAQYVSEVVARSRDGRGYLDAGDTPAFIGMYAAAATVVGTTLAALEQVMARTCARAFVPIAGLHHARRNRAAGFCIFNDCGVAIEALLQVYGVGRVAYVDIDAHHGDGVYYGFAADPRVIIVDFHEDGRFLYPGTGAADERGTGRGRGTKLNIPMAPNADDRAFRAAWTAAERFLDEQAPEVILLQCGADSLAGDPITHLRYSPETHRFVTERLCALAERHARGRLLAMGGGGYDPGNLASAWCTVVAELLRADAAADDGAGSQPPV